MDIWLSIFHTASWKAMCTLRAWHVMDASASSCQNLQLSLCLGSDIMLTRFLLVPTVRGPAHLYRLVGGNRFDHCDWKPFSSLWKFKAFSTLTYGFILRIWPTIETCLTKSLGKSEEVFHSHIFSHWDASLHRGNVSCKDFVRTKESTCHSHWSNSAWIVTLARVACAAIRWFS